MHSADSSRLTMSLPSTVTRRCLLFAKVSVSFFCDENTSKRLSSVSLINEMVQPIRGTLLRYSSDLPVWLHTIVNIER